MPARRGLLGLAIAGLALWFAGGPSDCKQAAQPLIDALERYHQITSKYPDTLDELVQGNLLRALPRPTWNLGVQHMDDFEYWVEHDLDYYCLAYAEAPLIGGIGPPHWDEVSYVSFRRGWDDSPAIPKCDLVSLPVQRAGERFRESRTSADLRLFVKKLIGSASQGCSIFWDDVAVSIGSGSRCAIEGHSGLCVEAGDNEAAAFFFITRRAHTSRGDVELSTRIFERYQADGALRWREVLHDYNEWEWLGPVSAP